MTYKEILPYCLFFKGEELPPKSFNQEDECLWFAEKIICEDCPGLISKDNPRISLAEAVYSYLGKWAPYKYDALMDYYLDKDPELKDSIKRI